MKRRSTTYKQAGVDVALAKAFIQSITPLAELTRRKGLIRGIGGFGGLFELNTSSSSRPILVASADGVGTKIRLAREACANRWGGVKAGWYEPLGVDLVAMNVNDILCTGAQPLFFLDYIAAGRLDPSMLIHAIRGMVRGCLQARCTLLGGETAQMPLIYGPKEFDLAGFAVGLVDRQRLVTGERIRPGDQVLGLASSGLHSNGFTLVQKVLSPAKQRAWAKSLLSPTRIYVGPVLDLLRSGVPVAGIAHITGGSFSEKISRILPEGLGVVLQKGSWPVPSIFQRIQACGVSEPEMYRTFNMGIGLVLILPARAVNRAKLRLRRHRLATWVIGEVTRGRREVVLP